MERSKIQQRFVDQAIEKALVNSRLGYDNPIRDTLNSEAEIVGLVGRPCVRIVSANGDWLMLEDRIMQLRTDPRFRDFDPHPTRVAKGDADGVRDNFEAIASGAAVVE